MVFTSEEGKGERWTTHPQTEKRVGREDPNLMWQEEEDDSSVYATWQWCQHGMRKLQLASGHWKERKFQNFRIQMRRKGLLILKVETKNNIKRNASTQDRLSDKGRESHVTHSHSHSLYYLCLVVYYVQI